MFQNLGSDLGKAKSNINQLSAPVNNKCLQFGYLIIKWR